MEDEPAEVQRVPRQVQQASREVRCSHCSVSLTFHRKQEKLVCHMCGYQRVAPRKCPECNAPSIRFAGYGTEKVEEFLRKVFPVARLARVDTDTMSRKGALRTT